MPTSATTKPHLSISSKLLSKCFCSSSLRQSLQMSEVLSRHGSRGSLGATKYPLATFWLHVSKSARWSWEGLLLTFDTTSPSSKLAKLRIFTWHLGGLWVLFLRKWSAEFYEAGSGYAGLWWLQKPLKPWSSWEPCSMKVTWTKLDVDFYLEGIPFQKHVSWLQKIRKLNANAVL